MKKGRPTTTSLPCALPVGRAIANLHRARLTLEGHGGLSVTIEFPRDRRAVDRLAVPPASERLNSGS